MCPTDRSIAFHDATMTSPLLHPASGRPTSAPGMLKTRLRPAKHRDAKAETEMRILRRMD
jgi:hypothetical protein